MSDVIVTYSSNNSGGGWWLGDKDWFALEDAGWTVHWMHDLNLDHGEFEGKDGENDPHKWDRDRLGRGYDSLVLREHNHGYGPTELKLIRVPRPSADLPDEDRYLGALAKSASKRFASADEAIAEFEHVAGQVASDEGCNCCGPPHSFEYEDAEGQRHYTHVEVVETRIGWS